MNNSGSRVLHIALIHYPVLNRRGETIGSAITNLDIHDIARMARTYGVQRYHLVTPYEDQHKMIDELLEHWRSGHGARYNPARKEALSIVTLADHLDKVVRHMTEEYGQKPLVVATTAVAGRSTTSYTEVRGLLDTDVPVLLLLGTAHGLADSVFDQSDLVLPPIQEASSYNHLSVRSAASIIIDRLLGKRENDR